MSTTTGRFRWRRSCFGKIVLQVEIVESIWTGSRIAGPGHAFRERRIWRDATLDDMRALGPELRCASGYLETK